MPRISAFLSALLIASAMGAPSSAQGNPNTGITLTLAAWLEPWEEGGGWIAVPAGSTLRKMPAPIAETAAAFPPGSYDVYWVEAAGAAPLPIAAGVDVGAGTMTEVRATTGVTLEVADWVPPRGETGWFGAILPTANDFDFVNVTRAGDSLFLPPGEYDFFYEAEGDDVAPVWLGTQTVEAPFGGLGVEVTEQDGDIVVVRALPGTPAEAAGVLADDVITEANGVVLTGLALSDAVAAMRGPAGTEITLTVRRGKETVEIAFARSLVEPFRTVRANNGIQIVTEAGVLQPEGWWGVAFAGEPVESFDDIVLWIAGPGGSLLVGPVAYDLYWSPDGVMPPILVEAGVTPNGELVRIEAGTPR